MKASDISPATALAPDLDPFNLPWLVKHLDLDPESVEKETLLERPKTYEISFKPGREKDAQALHEKLKSIECSWYYFKFNNTVTFNIFHKDRLLAYARGEITPHAQITQSFTTSLRPSFFQQPDDIEKKDATLAADLDPFNLPWLAKYLELDPESVQGPIQQEPLLTNLSNYKIRFKADRQEEAQSLNEKLKSIQHGFYYRQFDNSVVLNTLHKDKLLAYAKRYKKPPENIKLLVRYISQFAEKQPDILDLVRDIKIPICGKTSSVVGIGFSASDSVLERNSRICDYLKELQPQIPSIDQALQDEGTCESLYAHYDENDDALLLNRFLSLIHTCKQALEKGESLSTSFITLCCAASDRKPHSYAQPSKASTMRQSC